MLKGCLVGCHERRIAGTCKPMVKLLVVLTLRLVFSVAAIVGISFVLSLPSVTKGERKATGKQAIGVTLLAWIMVEALVFLYDLLPVSLWLVLCLLGVYLHTGVISRFYERDMKSVFPTALFHAGTIVVALLLIIHALEEFWRSGFS